MIIPFGKFKSQTIDSLPSSYLLWVAENVSEKQSEVNRMVALEADREWEFREKFDEHFE